VIDLPRSADVVIGGGGFAGMSTAWALRRRKIEDVIVLEREAELGVYASGRSAGLGRQLAEDDAWTALTVRGAALLRTELAATWTETGGVLTFDNADHAQTYVERAARFGIDAELITREMVLGHWPDLAAVEIAAALHVPSDGAIAVGPLLQLYAQGVAIARRTAVTAIEPMQGGARVKTSRGDIVARVVVDATGAWAGQLLGEPPMPAFKRHVFWLDAKPSAGAPFVWHLGACELYLRDAGGVTLASPCDSVQVPAGDQQADADGTEKLRRALAGSSLERASIPRAWACQRTFAPSGAMLLERDPDRPWLVWAAGLGGHGATASGAVGEAVAEVVAGLL
jgi:glycine/D-amino acid oxidase-like deaminating enzyme